MGTNYKKILQYLKDGHSVFAQGQPEDFELILIFIQWYGYAIRKLNDIPVECFESESEKEELIENFKMREWFLVESVGLPHH